MTALTKAVRRLTETSVRDQGKSKRLVVTLYPGGLVLGLRPERTRREETITLDAVYSLAVKMRVSAERKAKAAAKKGRAK